LVWESLRLCPEGLTAALVNSETAKETLLRYTAVLDEPEKPQIAVTDNILPTQNQCEKWFFCSEFDHILIRITRLPLAPDLLAANTKPLLSKNGNVVLLTSPPRLGERISRLITGNNQLISKLEQAEAEFFDNISGQGLWETQEISKAFEDQGFSVETALIDQKEERLITEKDITPWFNTDQSRWGSFIAGKLEKSEFMAVEEALRAITAKGPLLWRWKSLCLHAKLKNCN
jgi:putative ATPase